MTKTVFDRLRSHKEEKIGKIGTQIERLEVKIEELKGEGEFVRVKGGYIKGGFGKGRHIKGGYVKKKYVKEKYVKEKGEYVKRKYIDWERVEKENKSEIYNGYLWGQDIAAKTR